MEKNSRVYNVRGEMLIVRYVIGRIVYTNDGVYIADTLTMK